MIKRIVLIIIFLLSPVLALGVCNDSDGGADYFTYGYVDTEKGLLYDNCTNQATLNEYICADNASGKIVTSCTYGCLNGRCNQSPLDEIKYTFSTLFKSFLGFFYSR